MKFGRPRDGRTNQPTCEPCIDEADPKKPLRKAEYFSPELALDLCQEHAVSTGALTRGRCWPWNYSQGRFDRD